MTRKVSLAAGGATSIAVSLFLLPCVAATSPEFAALAVANKSPRDVGRRRLLDPWGSPYATTHPSPKYLALDDPRQRVYSLGPNQLDEGGAGDDVLVEESGLSAGLFLAGWSPWVLRALGLWLVAAAFAHKRRDVLVLQAAVLAAWGSLGALLFVLSPTSYPWVGDSCFGALGAGRVALPYLVIGPLLVLVTAHIEETDPPPSEQGEP